MGAKEQLLAHFDSLSPKQRAAARFVIDHPNEVVICSMRTLAERAGAQPATLVRLAQQIGYAGWPALKTAFATDLGLHTGSYGQRAKSLTARGSSTDLLSEMFEAQRHNLSTTKAECAGVLREAAHLLRHARAVHVAGFRASYPMAYALVYGYRLFRDSVHLLDGHGGGLEMQLRPVQNRDVVVIISFAPYSRECMAVIQAAQAAGASILAITDSAASPPALAAELSILFSVASPSFFPSVGAGLAVIEALLALLVAESGASVVQRIHQSEQSLMDSGAYLPAPR
ncbi:MurR/RpiR family transcriptional regulator [Ottowia sp.]|uniref:MurR/RpiR family transcriptional regulator n=1 Tax=Ottowia sp. TaxID=1898956 RepID=UPI0039E46A7E